MGGYLLIIFADDGAVDHIDVRIMPYFFSEFLVYVSSTREYAHFLLLIYRIFD